MNFPEKPEERSDIQALEIPSFKCEIPEMALNKLSPEFREIISTQDVLLQYMKYHSEVLRQINMQARRTNGNVKSLLITREEERGDHEKVATLDRCYQRVVDWKTLFIIIAIISSSILGLIINLKEVI